MRLLCALGPLVAVFGGSCRPAGRARTASTDSVRPPFVVVVIVDQLGAWVADERWPALPADGGFARLRREGLTVRDMRYGHATTETAPGHAALFTGAPPRVSGIFGNEVVPAPGAEPVSILTDPTTRLIALPEGTADAAAVGSSLAALRVETLADVLESERSEKARVLSVSLKDRAALFGGGRRPTVVAWFDPKRETFVTSSAFPLPAGPWADGAAAGRVAISQALARPWAPLDWAWLRAHAETDDANPAEGDYEGMGREFPHPVRTGKALRATPSGDRAIAAAATSLIRTAARVDGPTLLVLSLSSYDYVSHVFGPHSYEAWDELRQVDRVLAELLATLDGARGSRDYAVMLTADHGSAPLAELSSSPRDPWCRPARSNARHRDEGGVDHWERGCGPRHLLAPGRLASALETAAVAALGPGPWIAGIAAPWVFLTERGKRLPASDRARLLAAARGALRSLAGIERVVDVRAQPSRCPGLSDESLDALICRSVVPDGNADLFLLPRRGDFFDPRMAEGHGANHGSPYLYDRAVPLVVRAPGRVPAGAVIEAPLPYTAFTRTAAALLGVRPPRAAEPGPDLTHPG